LCCELIKRSGKKISIESLLKIAAIGTIADVAPLVGENRTIASLGLHALADVRNPGLRALLKRLGLNGRALRAVDVGFKIGPRINAAGRLASANTAIDLFAATDEDAAWQLCAELDRMNTERQTIELQVRECAEQQIAGGERVLILAGDGWHRGVLGLTAGRIAQRYHRPTLVMTIEGDLCIGSGRSIPTINLHEELSAVDDLFLHFGGHEFACGFSLAASNLSTLRERLHARFESLDESLFRREARVDGVLTLAGIDHEFVAAHEMLQPFGAGNPHPLFLIENVTITGTRMFAEDCSELSLEDATGRGLGVLWPSAKELAPQLVRTVDLLVRVEPDRFNGGGRVEVVDVRKAQRLQSAEAQSGLGEKHG
jgi:single-stranded-DNA-specific exonuclease